MKIEFKPKLTVKPSQSLEKEFIEEVNNRKEVKNNPEEKVTLGSLREFYKRIAEFGGVKMSEEETETDDDGNRKIEREELAFKKSGYLESLRPTEESKKIAEIRKNLIAQFSNPIPKN
jgi:hypothetical protein